MPYDIVPGYGRKPSAVLLCGEAPGKQEHYTGRPFVGRSGQELEWYFGGFSGDVSPRTFYMTNVVKRYIEKNPDPTPALIAEWSPVLEAELAEVRPVVILAVGRFAVRWFLGDTADMESVVGLPHPAGAFDASRRHRGGPNNAIVIPLYHPAFGLHDADRKADIVPGYDNAVKIIKAVTRGAKSPISTPTDAFLGAEQYMDVSGAETADVLADLDGDQLLTLDTEGDEVLGPWSVQISDGEGRGYLLRYARLDFRKGADAIQRAVNLGTTVGIHNALFDIDMARQMGIELRHAKIYDTMYGAYLTRRLPQGLKPLSYRLCGMRMASYLDTVSGAARGRHLEYLHNVLSCAPWPKPPQVLVQSNDGTARVKQPQAIERRMEKLISDFYDTGKGKGDDLDIYRRWQEMDDGARAMIEERCGPLLPGSLADLPLADATYYACRDVDAVSRIIPIIRRELRRLDLTQLMDHGMEILPVFEEMQATGMRADVEHFELLESQTTNTMELLQARLSNRFFDGRPFNPMSADHVRVLMRRLGIEGETFTKSGKVSTSKKSIAHHRKSHIAMGMLFDWREAAKVRDGFCRPVLEKAKSFVSQYPDEERYAGVRAEERVAIRCKILTTRVHTRRLATKDPNYLAMPSRNEYSTLIRYGFFPPEGCVFGGWDLSQIEMRRAAGLSRDPLMCALFTEGRCTTCGTIYKERRSGPCGARGCTGTVKERDMHTETAANIFGLRLDEVDKVLHRNPAKNAGFGCVPLDTEALTPAGWASYRDVMIGDTVIGYNPRTKTLQKTRVIDKVVYRDAPLVEMGNAYWSTISTPNHRWYGECRRMLNGVRKTVQEETTTEELTGEYRICVAAPYKTVDGPNISLCEAELLGWILGDGSIRESSCTSGRTSQAGGRKRGLRVTIWQAKKVGVERLRVLLRDIDHVERSRRGNASYFDLSPSYSRGLFQRAGYHSGELDAFVLRLSHAQRAAFVEGVFGAEGYTDSKGGKHIGQNSGEKLEAIRLAILLLGFSPSKTVNDTRGNAVNYDVRFRQPFVTGQRIVKRPVHSAPVWCIKTELGSWVMRQGDTMSITGNTLYGISGRALFDQFRMMGAGANWSVKKCEKLIADWLDLYSGLKRYIAQASKEVRRDGGIVRDEWGMMRYIPGIFHYDRGVVEAAARVAVSHRVQGGAQGMIQNSMRWLRPRIAQMQAEGHNVGWNMQIHDEVILYFPPELWGRMNTLVMTALTRHHGVSRDAMGGVPVDANGHMGWHWGDLK